MHALSWIILFACAACISASYETLFHWKYMNYAWKSFEQMNYYMFTGKYDYRNVIPVDVDRSRKDNRIFVTVQGDQGVPAGVNVLVYQHGFAEPLLSPYPNWQAYEQPILCNNIISVHRIAIDECNRLWILDTGKLGNNTACPPKLLVYNLDIDKLIMTRIIPTKYSQNSRKRGLLVTPIVETSGLECDETHVYIADSEGGAIITYSMERNKFRRFEDMEHQPEAANLRISIADESFTTFTGVMGMALSPMRYPDDARALAYKSLASRTIFNIDTRIFKANTEREELIHYIARNKLPSQATVMVFSSGGTLFYGLTSETAIGCYNLYKPLNDNSFLTVLTDPEKLQFVSGMKFIKNPYVIPPEEYLLVLSNRYQKVVRGTMDFNEINFRILKISVKALIAGTACDDY